MEINSTDIYKTYTDVGSIQWGIMAVFNPGVSQQKALSHQMEIQNFSLDQPCNKYFVSQVIIIKVVR